MTSIAEHTGAFQSIAARTIEDMFGIGCIAVEGTTESASVKTSKSFVVSILYTGTVYGEYLLALDEETAAQIVGIDEPITDENREEIRADFCDALSETLNTIVGESITHLQESYAKLTLTAPRLFFGDIRYPNFRTGQAVIDTDAGEIECHFCLDLMRLDLSTSYEEALESLVGVNEQLKEANRHLAEQQAQLVHTERMASVGILASGVAHEINNPLFFVDANLKTLHDYINVIESTVGLYEKLSQSLQGVSGEWSSQVDSLKSEAEEQDLEFVMEDTKQLVSETRDGISRIKTIVQGLRDFSQVDRAGFAETEINLIVENTCELLNSQIGIECEVVKQLGETPRIVCNAAELGQVIAGVIENASQAIEANGRIEIATEFVEDEVVISVTDNGHGIDQDKIDNIFEPFFSTKPEGEGVGLGLSIAYGVMKKHGGTIDVDSEPGGGTTVTLRLPVAPQATSCES